MQKQTSASLPIVSFSLQTTQSRRGKLTYKYDKLVLESQLYHVTSLVCFLPCEVGLMGPLFGKAEKIQ